MLPQKGFATVPPNPKCVSANGEFHQRAVLGAVSNNLHWVQLSQTQWKPKGFTYSSLGILRLSNTPGAGTCDMTLFWAKICSGKKGPQIMPRSGRPWFNPRSPSTSKASLCSWGAGPGTSARKSMSSCCWAGAPQWEIELSAAGPLQKSDWWQSLAAKCLCWEICDRNMRKSFFATSKTGWKQEDEHDSKVDKRELMTRHPAKNLLCLGVEEKFIYFL